MMKTAFVILSFAAIATAFKALTRSDIGRIKADINKMYANGGFRIIPTVTRLMFHDCAGDGSCNACVNLLTGNAGVEWAVSYLEKKYTPKYTKTMSRADFWHLAGIVAIEAAVNLNNNASATNPSIPFTPPLSLDFTYGREDCATSPNSTNNDNLPQPTMSSAKMFDWFKQNFGFNENQVTALMGAHTLGGARRENTGYTGQFITNERLFFNNKYYTQMLDNSLSIFNVAVDKNSTVDKKFQFSIRNSSRAQVGMRLNTDIELIYDIDVSPTAGTKCTVSGKAPTCPISTTNAMVKTYAKDPVAWMENFSAVYSLVIQHGFEGKLKTVDS